MTQYKRSLGAQLRGKIHLTAMEFFLTDTCNLRCQHCAASSPFMSETNLPSLEQFRESLCLLAPVVQCDELRLLGGEPLLNPEICSFIQAARESGIFRKLRVTTNGLLLPRMSEEFWRWTDIVRISVYPATAAAFPESKLQGLLAVAAKFGTRLEMVRNTHFLTAISDRRFGEEVVQQVFAACGEAHAWSCHLLYRDRLYRCSRVHTLDRYLQNIGVEHENFTELDGILIDNRPSLRSDLKNYLHSPVPLNACRFCFGTSGLPVAHAQLTVPEIHSKLETTAQMKSARRTR